MNFISALFHKRQITKAFNAVDNDNVAELAALKIDPNTTRKAVLGKYTFEWEENLLSRAVREGKYNAAQYLLDNGADPYSHDEINNDLAYRLLKIAADLVFKDEQLVFENSGHGGIGLLADPHTDFRLSPVLTTLVALEYHRRTGKFEQRYGSSVILSGPSILDTSTSQQKIQDWLNTQLPRYEAQRLNAHIGKTDDRPVSSVKRL